MKFTRDLFGVPGFRSGFAPAQAGTVVGAHARGLGDLLLHPGPVGRHPSVGGFQDHRGTALSDTVDVQAVSAHVHHFARWGIGALIYLRSDGLVGCPDNGEGGEPSDRAPKAAAGPKAPPPLWSASLR